MSVSLQLQTTVSIFRIAVGPPRFSGHRLQKTLDVWERFVSVCCLTFASFSRCDFGTDEHHRDGGRGRPGVACLASRHWLVVSQITNTNAVAPPRVARIYCTSTDCFYSCLCKRCCRLFICLHSLNILILLSRCVGARCFLHFAFPRFERRVVQVRKRTRWLHAGLNPKLPAGGSCSFPSLVV